jgi:LCP family protein required for cell wall assembly
VEEEGLVPPPRLHRRRRGARGLIVAGIVLLVVVAGGVWFDRAIYAPVSTITNVIIPVPTRVVATASATQAVSAPGAATAVPPAPPPPTATPFPSLGGTQRMNILLLGSDTDAKFTGSFITQIMIVASIDPVHHTISLLSIPRDFWVPIPGHGVGKIQVAFQFGEQDHPGGGGIALARQTIEDDFGIHIDHYAWIGLQGFIKVIDTAGGLDIDALHPVLDDNYPDDIANGQVTTTDIFASRRLYIPAGPQHMDGATALQYVRSRHADPIGDFGRSQRQQQVLLQLRKKVEQPGTLLQIPAYLNDLAGYVKSDFSVPDLFALGNFLRQYGRQPYTQYVLMPPDYSSLDTITVNGLVQDIVRPNWPTVHALVAHVFAPPAAAAPPAVLATGSAHIAVENGTTIGGLASQAATYLTSLGYTVDPAGNAGNTAYPATLVTVYNPEKQDIATMVAELFGGQVQTAPAGTSHGADDIVVTLGQDHGTFEGF